MRKFSKFAFSVVVVLVAVFVLMFFGVGDSQPKAAHATGARIEVTVTCEGGSARAVSDYPSLEVPGSHWARPENFTWDGRDSVHIVGGMSINWPENPNWPWVGETTAYRPTEVDGVPCNQPEPTPEPPSEPSEEPCPDDGCVMVTPDPADVACTIPLLGTVQFVDTDSGRVPFQVAYDNEHGHDRIWFPGVPAETVLSGATLHMDTGEVLTLVFTPGLSYGDPRQGDDTWWANGCYYGTSTTWDGEPEGTQMHGEGVTPYGPVCVKPE